jgi:hypothetical protein
LFLVGPAANLVEIWWCSRRKAASEEVAVKQQISANEVVIESPAWRQQEEAVEPPLTLIPK